MDYFHRTSLPPEEILAEADRYFGACLEAKESHARARQYNGTVGTVGVRVRPEGGHYVNVTVHTDQVGESEADKLAKRFLARVHKLAYPRHELRGAY